MNGPSARALREGGTGGSIPYKTGVTLVVKLQAGGQLPSAWRKKTTLQAPFGEYGQVLRIDIQESQGCVYVEYEDEIDARDAQKELNGTEIAGKKVSVEMIGQTTSRRPGSSIAPVGPPGRVVDIEQQITELVCRYFLDEAAASRLASVFQDRARLGCDLRRDFQELGDHLAASSKPSALVSMKLGELRSGRTIGPCKFASGARRQLGDAMEVGSRAHSSYRSADYFEEGGDRDKSDDKDRTRDRDRDRDKDRDKDRDRDRDRKKERDRDRDKDRDRDRDKDRDRDRDRDKDRDKDKKSHERDRSRSKERDKSRNRKDEKKSKH